MRKPFSLASAMESPRRGPPLRGKCSGVTSAHGGTHDEDASRRRDAGGNRCTGSAGRIAAHTMHGQSTQNAPGTGGTSKPGLPGSKSRPSVTPSGMTVPEASRTRSAGNESKGAGAARQQIGTGGKAVKLREVTIGSAFSPVAVLRFPVGVGHRQGAVRLITVRF